MKVNGNRKTKGITQILAEQISLNYAEQFHAAIRLFIKIRTVIRMRNINVSNYNYLFQNKQEMMKMIK